ncbi:MAG TPA: aldehyde dehydrogenase family protein, partial [Gammaproteobacteria bacterium]|nr:aldehyde dehydrogenase family protein [Gammaproteobacteria bacterium]
YTEQPEPFMGPLISNAAADKVFAAYQKLVASGAKVLLEMRKPQKELAFVTPGIIDVTDVAVPDEEIFGPLLQVIWVDSFANAIRTANNTAYGLSAGLICNDANLYKEFMRDIHAGIVTWNRPTIGSSSAAPFGGLGKSGNHRPSAFLAADYCSYPVASMEASTLELPTTLNPGITL